MNDQYIDADHLQSAATEVLHCGRPMRYRNAHTTWQGKTGEGSETTTTTRICDCGAELTTTLRAPA